MRRQWTKCRVTPVKCCVRVLSSFAPCRMKARTMPWIMPNGSQEGLARYSQACVLNSQSFSVVALCTFWLGVQGVPVQAFRSGNYSELFLRNAARKVSDPCTNARKGQAWEPAVGNKMFDDNLLCVKRERGMLNRAPLHSCNKTVYDGAPPWNATPRDVLPPGRRFPGETGTGHGFPGRATPGMHRDE